MAELVQGVKLKYELGSSLPKPVSFPFESIGDYRPVSQIPKYDFTLEKQIMKEIAKQKQKEQYNALKQAQQQLTMVDIIASRKNRRKGKEPDRSSSSSVAASAVSHASLAKPSSDTGVSRPRQDHGVSATTGQAENSVTRPSVSPAMAAAMPQGAANTSAIATSEAGSGGGLGVGPGPGHPHSALPATSNASSASEPGGKASVIYPQVPAQTQPQPQTQTQQLPTTNTNTNTTVAGAYGPHKVTMPHLQQPHQHQQQQQQQLQASMQPSIRPIPLPQQQQQHIRPQIQGMPQPANIPQASQQKHANNGPLGFVIPPPAANQQHTRPAISLPQASPASTGTVGSTGIFPSFQQQHQPAAGPARHSYAPAPPVFSSSLPSWQAALPQKEYSAPVQPALPPKPEEWKAQQPHGSGVSNVGTSSSSLPTTSASTSTSTYSNSAPALPARNQNRNQRMQQQQQQQPQGPAPPAIPPKPFMAFSEFDYASDDVSGLGSSSHSGHVEQLNILLSMGFGRPQAIHALEMYDYDVNKASNYLIDKAFH
ncbi:hypothetical protein LPJ64_003181 [Coemansia asiatica]|uniref:UBA domain-containing protein n=1 Tax=Coemansia asiatica TaxID=1052880 RepID=A0A9W7XM76_9FUNG|nr:hypothetical protein LPJ64_003181 [Coemansia asiatica]